MDDFSGLMAPSNINWQGDVGVVEYGGGDKGMVCLFYTRPVHNPAKSRESGRQVFEDQAYVRIAPPGERFNIVDRPVREDDKRRFPLQWHQFTQNKQQIPDGTPVEQLYPEHPAIAATLRANAVHTIEQCAALSGPAIDSIGMGAQQYANDAKKYIELANKGVSATQMRVALEERDREINTMKRQLQEQAAIIDQLRQNNTQAGTVNQLLAQLAGGMERPVHLGKGFDPQTAMIAANHPTAQEKPQRRRRANLER